MKAHRKALPKTLLPVLTAWPATRLAGRGLLGSIDQLQARLVRQLSSSFLIRREGFMELGRRSGLYMREYRHAVTIQSSLPRPGTE